MGIKNKITKIMSVAAGGVCTAASDCTDAGSCCAGYMATADGTAQDGTDTVCIAAGAKKGDPVTLAAANASGATDVFAMEACAAAAAGASTLAISAVAATTALMALY